MPLTNTVDDELQQYRAAKDALTASEEHLNDPTLWVGVVDPSHMSPAILDDVVRTLCDQARAAQRLAHVAESLCSVLVGRCRPCDED